MTTIRKLQIVRNELFALLGPHDAKLADIIDQLDDAIADFFTDEDDVAVLAFEPADERPFPAA